MTKVVKLVTSPERARADEALRVLDQAYAYYTVDEVSAEAAIEAVETPIEQMYGYYPAA
ncbi:hypothetical protein [Paenirhodobacter sp.]|uniref:hypothetical protein n=1 Tax=Paenirhodobacter sp. TaxID=1965326 RepID=UPI003B40EA0E